MQFFESKLAGTSAANAAEETETSNAAATLAKRLFLDICFPKYF
ncbi:hypothetical protein GJA_4285 [Janthinobacterium agaricidamnosum NBRC 102515 = DSM 9628]|uniref:Uncharacterized protein n=1 Tax=Janthinobacterium agaricidamnosum NBRC 102515 = DSM 9628 TaxID=1349767 RepID=W0VC12_9BURK|nr:hypothetical protein GJA_4285 [Janthinobacterium agaricidamnosum NBRC 102515 = DSM 9628]